MLDALDRPLRDLRISVTDRCNLRCRYCMPREVFGADHPFLPRDELLSFEEIARVATLAARQGVDRIRLTGGEPLLRRELPRLVGMLAAIPGIDDLSLTTNGLLLARHGGRRSPPPGSTASPSASTRSIRACCARSPTPRSTRHR